MLALSPTILNLNITSSAPVRRGDLWFFSYNSGLQAQNVLYVQRELDGDSAVLLDPNKLSSDGTVRANFVLVPLLTPCGPDCVGCYNISSKQFQQAHGQLGASVSFSQVVCAGRQRKGQHPPETCLS